MKGFFYYGLLKMENILRIYDIAIIFHMQMYEQQKSINAIPYVLFSHSMIVED